MNRSDDTPPLNEPWHAQALATAWSLQDAGVITASEWSSALGAAIRRSQAAGDPDTGDTYYYHVLDALETLLDQKAIVRLPALHARKAEWVRAYRATPHGEAVVLGRHDLGSASPDE